MKRRSILTSSRLIAIAAGVAVGGSFWPSGRVAAIGSPDLRSEFGLVSVASGQVLRLSAASLGGPDTVGDPTLLARRLTLAFDVYGISDPNDGPTPVSPEDGLRLTHLRVLERQVVLRPGQAASFEFSASGDGALIGAVMIGDAEDAPDPRRGSQPQITTTLEVMQDGRTLFTHPALVKFFNPQRDPPGMRLAPGI
jgi:hypothetical protein